LLDGRKVGPIDVFGPGRWLEFSATFSNGQYQHIGFGLDYANPPWAIFSTATNGTSFQARSSNGSVASDFNLPITWNGVSHLYRIEWNAGTIAYFVDGNLLHTDSIAIGASMRPLAAEHDVGGPTISVDWLRMGPYASSGTYTSRVFDAGQSVEWLDLTATTTIPTGTTLTFATQTSANGSDWSDWQSVNSPIDSPNGRYLRYQATFTTTDSNITPTLEDVTITYNITPTAVKISSFTAHKQGAAILLTWETANELDLVGFNLYRSSGLAGERGVVNETPIAARLPGSAEGNLYEYLDSEIETGIVYTYWLEVVTRSGTTVLGPVSAGSYMIFIPLING